MAPAPSEERCAPLPRCELEREEEKAREDKRRPRPPRTAELLRLGEAAEERCEEPLEVAPDVPERRLDERFCHRERPLVQRPPMEELRPLLEEV